MPSDFEPVVFHTDQMRGLLVLYRDKALNRSYHVLSLVDKEGGRHMIPWAIHNTDHLRYLQWLLTEQYPVVDWQLAGNANEDEEKDIEAQVANL